MCHPLRAIDHAVGTNISGDVNNGPAPLAGGVQKGVIGTQPAAPAPAPAPAPVATPATPAPTATPAAAPTPDYASLAAGFTGFARPQIESQYSRAKDALSTGLANRGLAGSSIAHTYTGNLDSAYNENLGRLPADANTYAHSGASGYTPLGDLFTSIINPVATFNANNRFTPAGGQAPIAGSSAVGSGASTGSSDVNLSNGSSSRVVR